MNSLYLNDDILEIDDDEPEDENEDDEKNDEFDKEAEEMNMNFLHFLSPYVHAFTNYVAFRDYCEKNH